MQSCRLAQLSRPPSQWWRLFDAKRLNHKPTLLTPIGHHAHPTSIIPLHGSLELSKLSALGYGSLLFRSSSGALNNIPNRASNQSSRKDEKTTSDQDKDTDGEDDEKTKKRMKATMIMFMLSLPLTYLLVNSLNKESEKKIRALEAELRRRDSLGQQPTTAQLANTTSAPPAGAQPPRVLRDQKSFNVTWHEFVTLFLSKGLVEEIKGLRSGPQVYVKLKTPMFINGYQTDFVILNVPTNEIEAKLDRVQDELNIRAEDRVSVAIVQVSPLLKLFVSLVAVAGLVYGGRMLLAKVKSIPMNMFSQMTKANYTVVDPHLKSSVPKVSFKDIAGLHEAKVEIKEFVDYLSEPERYLKLGARVPKGALLLGPPGCGKTLLAKAVAAEANVPFFSMAGTEFIEMIGGVGAARVRNLFAEAKKQAPSIIYIDEIDAVGRKRSDADGGGRSGAGGGGSGELDQTLNQLLVSMDGLESNSNVIVLASTNRADVLDKALLRAGRLDRHISIDLPTLIERQEILTVHMRNLKVSYGEREKEKLISQLAHLTPRFSGADLANICNESALLAARDGQTAIELANFYAALERVVGGAEKKTSTTSADDRRLVAYQECGKVIVSWFHQYADLILKVSLLSRTKSNTFTHYLSSDRKIIAKEELFDQMCLFFGGRVAETLVFNKHSTQSEQDLKRITRLAYAQVESLGMNESIGNLSFPTRQEERASGGGALGTKPYSRKLRNLIDLEVNKLVAQAHMQVERTLKANMDKLHAVAGALLEKETLTYDDIVKLIGEPVNKDARQSFDKMYETSVRAK